VWQRKEIEMKTMKNWNSQDDLHLTKTLQHIAGLSAEDDNFKDLKQDFYLCLIRTDFIGKMHNQKNFRSFLYGKLRRFVINWRRDKKTADKHIKFVDYFAAIEEGEKFDEYEATNDEGLTRVVAEQIVKDWKIEMNNKPAEIVFDFAHSDEIVLNFTHFDKPDDEIDAETKKETALLELARSHDKENYFDKEHVDEYNPKFYNDLCGHEDRDIYDQGWEDLYRLSRDAFVWGKDADGLPQIREAYTQAEIAKNLWGVSKQCVNKKMQKLRERAIKEIA
jgi:DNA-directed RNA polymerase specialized sigma24 family protein